MWRTMDQQTDLLNGLAENFNEVKLIRLDKNYGFAGGYNRAIESA